MEGDEVQKDGLAIFLLFVGIALFGLVGHLVGLFKQKEVLTGEIIVPPLTSTPVVPPPEQAL